MLLPLFYGFTLSFIHFWNEQIHITDKRLREKISSLTAGVSVSYLFLVIFPEIFETFIIDRIVFLALLIGFTSVHLVEKYIYQRSRPEELRESFGSVHAASFFIYNFLIGVVIVKVTQFGVIRSLLFMLPLLFYAGIGLVALENISEKIRNNLLSRFLLAFSTLLGILFAEIIFQMPTVFATIFGLTVGAFLYIVLLDFIPRKENGQPLYFAFGIISYSLIILLIDL